MNDQQARRFLALYADGELDPQRAAELELLLERSAELRAELERWQALNACIRGVASDPKVPLRLEQAIQDGLRRNRIEARTRILRLFGGGTAVAAAVMVAIGVWTPAAVAHKSTLAARCFACIHLDCAAKHQQPCENSAPQDILATRMELAGSKAYRVLLPDLRDQGFELAGACQCHHRAGVELVHAFYQRPAPEPATVSVFSVAERVRLKDCRCKECACRDGVHRDYEVGRYRDLVVYKWDEAANSFALCSDLSREQLRDLAEHVELAYLGRFPLLVARAEP
jgi:hypothetical protein